MRNLCQLVGVAAAGLAGHRCRSWVEVRGMLQDLATLAPSAIVCAAFLTGVVMLLRHEMAPKRRARQDAQARTEGKRRDPSEP